MTQGHYILQGHDPVMVDVLTWARWFETAERHVADDRIGEVHVSTVFLGLDHNWDVDGPPLLFETMVFGGPLDEEQARYSTWSEALDGYDAACTVVRLAAERRGDG